MPIPLPLAPESLDPEDAFLRHVCETPDDDTPRLVYADWLEEHGNLPRAQFIRLQCQIARLEEWSPERLDLEDRAEDLLRKNRSRWHGNLPDWARYTGDPWFGTRYRRGFIDRVVGSAGAFVRSADRVFAAAPVQEARLHSSRDGGRRLATCQALTRLARLELSLWDNALDVTAFLASPYISGLTGLGFTFHAPAPGLSGASVASPMLGDEEAALLAACPRLTGLRELGLGVNRIGPDGVAALAHSPHLARLEQLSLCANPVGARGVEHLAEAGLVKQFTELDLGAANLGNEGLRALAAGQPGRLRKLNIRGARNQIGPAGMQALGRCEHLHNLRQLDMWGVPMRKGTVRALAGSPHLGGLTELKLSSASLDDEGARILARSRHLRSLRRLDLQSNNIGAEGMAALARSPVLASVTNLLLYNNPAIGDEGAVALAASEHLGELRQLTLVTAGIGPNGARAIAQSPNFPQLRDLDLQSHPLGDEGGKALCEAPYLRRIRALRLYNCGIGEDVTAALRRRFGKALHI